MRRTLLNTSIVAIIFTLLSIDAFAKDFDFKGKFGFDLSSTSDFVYSTLSKKYTNEILQQEINLSVVQSKTKKNFIALTSNDTLKDFFSANRVYITFDESKTILSIDLMYDIDGIGEDSEEELNAIKHMANQFQAVREIATICDSIKPGKSEEITWLYFSNCAVMDLHSVKDKLFAISFSEE